MIKWTIGNKLDIDKKILAFSCKKIFIFENAFCNMAAILSRCLDLSMLRGTSDKHNHISRNAIIVWEKESILIINTILSLGFPVRGPFVNNDISHFFNGNQIRWEATESQKTSWANSCADGDLRRYDAHWCLHWNVRFTIFSTLNLGRKAPNVLIKLCYPFIIQMRIIALSSSKAACQQQYTTTKTKSNKDIFGAEISSSSQ